ncbi:TonB-dependent receptor [Planctobacterium marinum]|uniref:TonB-dependent receptor n=1 Tax=Planctobacterium marinum TaxID=1631968 RepID=UPI001E305D3D|nr:TonB-dependent receptor [Planctobacterium marinum]MCC2603890.1 TonB-dependent receptor [Planctobacterium marinum]
MIKKSAIAVALQCALISLGAQAQEQEAEDNSGLETITVKAQKRTQSIQDVPISISALNGEKFEAIFSGGDDILSLAARAPGLNAESSNGRVAPRFYLRGLGNTDFDLAASQPVSIVMDDVVKENVILKSFPLFDIEQVEVLRGPQGSLFGRNTTAGIVKFDTRKPTQEFEAFVEASLGSMSTANLEAAVGGGLSDNLSGRFSILSQNRGDWIDNAFTGENDAMGGYNELAWRGQLLWEPGLGDTSVLLQVYGRDLEGTASIFRANALTTGSNEFNSTYDRDVVYYDADLDGDGQQDRNPQNYENTGVTLRIDKELRNDITFSSITDYNVAEGDSLGDIDGGVSVPGDYDNDGEIDNTYPGFIPFTAVTQDRLDDLHQFTHEVRFVESGPDDLDWTIGAYVFDAEFDVTSIDGFYGATRVRHSNQSWALFGQMAYDVSDDTTVTFGLNYTNDEKQLTVVSQNVDGFALVIGAASIQDYPDVQVDDSQVSGDLSINHSISRDVSVYARAAVGFRAPTIQGRDVAFESAPSVADSETVTSFEAGFKADLLDRVLRLNGAIYHYEVEDMQFSAIGGDGNFTRLINADKGIGQGFEVEATWLAAEGLTLTAGYSYNDTEIDDPNLRVSPGCGAGQCTLVDQTDANGLAIVDGNPFPQAPKTNFSFTARYAFEIESGEIFAYTDWVYQGETNLFLYDSVEFTTDSQFEGGLRVGYENFDDQYTVTLFGRNITDEENLRGAIDFNNLTVIDNNPRVWGVEFRKEFY